MDKLYYCSDCQRIFDSMDECSYCNSKAVRELGKNAPINVLGSKLKGRVLKVKQNTVDVLFTGEKRVKSIRQYEAEKLKKIL